jgi:hypothetical protein
MSTLYRRLDEGICLYAYQGDRASGLSQPFPDVRSTVQEGEEPCAPRDDISALFRGGNFGNRTGPSHSSTTLPTATTAIPIFLIRLSLSFFYRIIAI